MANEKLPPHFDISAAVVKQLGEELITDEVTALMELVKNSYDADAKWVKVDIYTNQFYENNIQHFKDNKLGFISIEDGGFGMSDDEIIDGWLIISLSHKRAMKSLGKTTPDGRTPLGDKGLGRLSSQRLGNRLEMLTVKEGTHDINHIAFDWSLFTEEVSLTKVPIFIDRIHDENSKKGTRLIITNLKDIKTWEGDAVEKIKGQLSQLIFPYKEKRKFKVYLSINGESINLDELNENLRDQAASRYEISFKDNKLEIFGRIKLLKLLGNKGDDKIYYDKLIAADFGRNFFQFLTDPIINRKNHLNKLKYNGQNGWFFSFRYEKKLEDLPQTLIKKMVYDEEEKKEVERDVFADPGSFKSEIDDYDLRGSETIEAVFDNLSNFKLIVKNQVGIRVFRDGFGIKPFGINGEDWLNLGGGQTHGSSFYGLRPNNVIGFVSISAKENEQLKEKTDREGFVESPYTKNFFDLMEKAIKEINDVIENTKRSYNEFKKIEAEKDLGISSIKDVAINLKKTASSARKLEDQTQKLETKLNNAFQGFIELKDKSNDKQNDKILAQIEAILKDSKVLFTNISSIINDAKKLENVANYLTPRINELELQLDEFSELAGLGLTAEALSHEMSNIVDRLVDQTSTVKKSIKVQKVTNPSILIFIEYVNSIIKSFRKQLSHLSPLLRYARETKEIISIAKFAHEQKSYYEERFKGLITFKVDNDNSDFEILVSKGKITQITDNLILNSEYWLKEKLKTEKEFKPSITFQIRKPFIRIFDNGNGVDPELDNRIFQPFVTGKPKDIGRGLGLFIIQQLLDSIGCDISLQQEKNPYQRKYIFQINLDSLINT